LSVIPGHAPLRGPGIPRWVARDSGFDAARRPGM